MEIVKIGWRFAVILPSFLPPMFFLYGIPHPFHHLWIYMVSKKHSGKADQLKLASGGSKHACSCLV